MRDFALHDWFLRWLSWLERRHIDLSRSIATNFTRIWRFANKELYKSSCQTWGAWIITLFHSCDFAKRVDGRTCTRTLISLLALRVKLSRWGCNRFIPRPPSFQSRILFLCCVPDDGRRPEHSWKFSARRSRRNEVLQKTDPLACSRVNTVRIFCDGTPCSLWRKNRGIYEAHKQRRSR